MLIDQLIIKCIGKKIIFPFYHLVSDEECPHIKHLYPIKNITKFKNEIEFFQKHFQPIELDEIIKHVLNGTNPERPSFFLSFDDGLRECYSVIAPILKSYDLKAAFFVNTGFIDNKELFFRYKVSLIIDHLKKTNQKSIYTKTDLLGLNYQDREKINKIGIEVGVDFSNFLKIHKPYMSWEEIKELKKEGFYIGSHSLDHPLYSNIPLNEQIYQTKESLNQLDKELDLGHLIFSFPFTDFGVNANFFKYIYQNKILNLSFGTAGIKDDVFNKNLQRLPMDDCTKSIRKFILKNVLLYRIKRLLNKNKVIHK